jgi:hypothetical protein
MWQVMHAASKVGAAFLFTFVCGCNGNAFVQINKELCDKFTQLAVFCLRSWPVFIYAVGRFLFTQLADGAFPPECYPGVLWPVMRVRATHSG